MQQLFLESSIPSVYEDRNSDSHVVGRNNIQVSVSI